MWVTLSLFESLAILHSELCILFVHNQMMIKAHCIIFVEAGQAIDFCYIIECRKLLISTIWWRWVVWGWTELQKKKKIAVEKLVNGSSNNDFLRVSYSWNLNSLWTTTERTPEVRKPCPDTKKHKTTQNTKEGHTSDRFISKFTITTTCSNQDHVPNLFTKMIMEHLVMIFLVHTNLKTTPAIIMLPQKQTITIQNPTQIAIYHTKSI